MSKWIKGMVVGAVIGVAIGSMINMDDMTCMAKKYMRKGRRIINSMM